MRVFLPGSIGLMFTGVFSVPGSVLWTHNITLKKAQPGHTGTYSLGQEGKQMVFLEFEDKRQVPKLDSVPNPVGAGRPCRTAVQRK